MTMVHPATARVADPELPAVAELLSEPIPGPVAAVIAEAGGQVTDCRTNGVTWWPGSSITVRYRVTVEGGALAGTQDMVAVAGRIPRGAVVVGSGEDEVGVWRVPHDPALPGLPAALDDSGARQILTDLGGADGAVRTRLRAYRPGRRAVVSVAGASHDVFLKIVRPRKVEQLHRDHKFLSEHLPVPLSLGYSERHGLMALQAMPGLTLRDVLEDPAAELPAPEELADVLLALPTPLEERRSRSIIERVPALGEMLGALVPGAKGAVDRFVEGLGGDDVDDWGPVHGDFYEAQVMVAEGRVVGLIDVDTYGLGRRGDDPGVMLGHLALWETMSAQPARVRDYALGLLGVWDKLYDPYDIRRRAAATLFTLASGPFRVQTADWPGQTIARVDLAQRWLDSAQPG